MLQGAGGKDGKDRGDLQEPACGVRRMPGQAGLSSSEGQQPCLVLAGVMSRYIHTPISICPPGSSPVLPPLPPAPGQPPAGGTGAGGQGQGEKERLEKLDRVALLLKTFHKLTTPDWVNLSKRGGKDGVF